MAEVEKLIEIYRQLENAGLMVTAGKKSAAELMVSHDVVPVVRCKDCKCWMYEYDDVGLCVTDVPDIDGVQRLACDFCSYGERRTDE